ncbi:MAG: hypothetical protein M3O26_04755 [Pseudomonadota bacterium]|nr:hypothetical protein [Pseudomonadota bacterium]
MLRIVFFGMIACGLAGHSHSQSQLPSTACRLPAEPAAIPAAIDAAITGYADKDRTCMQALFTPEARLVVVDGAAEHAANYTVLTVDDWIARVKPRGHALLEEKQVKVDAERFDRIVHLWSTYVLHSDGKQVARGINSIQAIKVSGGWRVLEILWQAESAATPLPKEFLP